MIKKILKWLVIIVLLLVVAIGLFIGLHPTFGGKPDAQSLQKIQQSQNYDGNIFQNLEPTTSGLKEVDTEDEQAGGMLDMLFPPEGKHPNEPLPTLKFNKETFKNGDFVWFGHLTALFKTDDKVIMVDPVYHSASPVSFAVAPFDMTNRPSIEELPNIDAVLISHDHYDHLDYEAIKKLDAKVTHFYVPLGIKAHLQRWGVADSKITEMDWYDESKLINSNQSNSDSNNLKSQSGGIDIILTPSRHFSGRSINDQSKTLWGSWVVKSSELSLFFSGDSGYGKHYAEIGKRYGGFDIALMEDGQYNVR